MEMDMGMSNECRLRGDFQLRAGVDMDDDAVCEVIAGVFDHSNAMDFEAYGKESQYRFEVELWGHGGFSNDQVHSLVKALQPIAAPCVLEFVDTEMSPDSADAITLYPVGQSDAERKHAMLEHALDYLSSEYGNALPLIGGKPVWEVVRALAQEQLVAPSTAVQQLRDALELGPSIEHTLPGGEKCRCSQCEFVRARRAALEGVRP
jgi:hypothetical protein